jgi:hypothetical protein
MEKSTDEQFKEALQRLGEIFTEDELIEELNKIPGFWERRAAEAILEEMETATNH